MAKIYSVAPSKPTLKQKLYKGGRNADAFVVARAFAIGGTVVTAEHFKPNAVKLPNICKHFGISWLDLEASWRGRLEVLAASSRIAVVYLRSCQGAPEAQKSPRRHSVQGPLPAAALALCTFDRNSDSAPDETRRALLDEGARAFLQVLRDEGAALRVGLGLQRGVQVRGPGGVELAA